MAATLAQPTKQIAKLQREADLLKASQAKGVITRIREDIIQYQLTAADLGFERGATPAKKRRVPVKPSPKKTRSATKTGRRTSLKKVTGTKYRDGDGNEW